jgi:hypothetical protein
MQAPHVYVDSDVPEGMSLVQYRQMIETPKPRRWWRRSR